MSNSAIAIDTFVAEILEGKGYVVLPNLLSPEEAAEARSLTLQLAADERPTGKTIYHENRERVYGLIYKGRVFEKMVQHPDVLSVVEGVLGEATLGGFSAHVLYPEATAMGVHVDYPYFTLSPPYPAQPVLEIQTIWMVEDFTETNGAPVMAAHTQKRCAKPDPAEFAEIGKKITGTAGSVVISHGLCWHDTSINESNQPRVSILGNYTPIFINPIEDPQRDFDQAAYDAFSPKLREMLCFNVLDSLLKRRDRHKEKS